jgi:hypothetical protein
MAVQLEFHGTRAVVKLNFVSPSQKHVSKFTLYHAAKVSARPTPEIAEERAIIDRFHKQFSIALRLRYRAHWAPSYGA